jgi:methyl-accepting chemotaxis protein
MKKINNYIRYLLILILLKGTKVFAQTSESLNQISSQTHQGSSNLLSSTTSSFINSNFFSEIIKQNIDKLEYYFINYAMPFLFVFGILYYLTKEANKEMNRPLLLIYIIIALFVTKILHDILLIPALIFIPILIIVVFHKIFRGITGSIIGFLTAITILFGVLTNNSLEEFLSPTGYFIFLFVLFITIFILSIKIGKELLQSKGVKQLRKNIKELSYFINKPENIRELEEHINRTIEDFRKFAKNLNDKIENLGNALFNPQNQQQNQQDIQNTIKEIEEIITSYKELQEAYKDILNYINDIEKNINIYDEAIRPQISNFLNKKKKELFDIKNSVDIKYNSILNSPRAKQIIKDLLTIQNFLLTRQISQDIAKKLRSITKQIQKLKNILKKIKDDYDDLIRKISSINLNNFNDLIDKINDLIKNAQNFLITLNEQKQEFDSEFNKIPTDLKNLQPYIDKIPNQGERANFHMTVDTLKTSINRYRQDFYNYYNQYHQTINELISHLQLIKGYMEDLEKQIKKLNGYYDDFKKKRKLTEKNTIAGRFIDFYNKNTKNLIDRIIQHISNIPTPMTTRSLYNAIEALKTKLLTAIQQLNNDIEQKYEEMKDFHANRSRQRRNQRQQNRQQDNRRGNRNVGRRRR